MAELDVIVVGGGLAGMAAAARLTKQRHRVALVEARRVLGGSWASQELDGTTVDDLPPVIDFPGPWRDLFRKCGRPLEAELERRGLALEPAPIPTYTLPDGVRLALPADRGGQFRALSTAYGVPVAECWRDLVDGLAAVWQTVRPLGLERELRGRSQLDPATRKALRWSDTVAELAQSTEHPGLAALVELTAYRIGSDPARTPAWVAVQLYVERTFGRWTLGRTSTLADLLADRLALRRVEVHLNERVERLLVEGGRVTGVVTPAGERRARLVLATVDPELLYGRLIPHPPRAERRGVRRSTPALRPAVEVEVAETPVPDEVALGPAGPRLTWCRPTEDGRFVITRHDHGHPRPDPSAGIAWDGVRSWLRRPPIRSALPGLLTAGPAGRGGAEPWATVLSAALAAGSGGDLLRE